MSDWQERRMREWIGEHPLTALAAKTPTEPAYAERLHHIATALSDAGAHDRAAWVWRMYDSAGSARAMTPPPDALEQ